ncbi:MAG TPA: DUF5939 domain-containing protein [Rhizobiaceae bacterium]|nr:DUF5939 domain-containing protein [Rhizobiaceae bacterium]
MAFAVTPWRRAFSNISGCTPTAFRRGSLLSSSYPCRFISIRLDLIAILRQSADARVADAIGRLIDEGPDRHLCRINVLAFADRNGFDQPFATSTGRTRSRSISASR